MQRLTIIAVLTALVAAVPAVAQERAPAPAPAPAGEERPWIGVWLGDAVDGGVRIARVVPDGPAAVAGLASGDGGVRIARVVPDGPAAVAGLASGDVIVEVDGTPVPSEERLGLVLGRRRAGDVVRFHVIRGGDAVTVPVRTLSWSRRSNGLLLEPGRSLLLAPRADPDVPARVQLQLLGQSGLGLTVSTMTPELRAHFGAPEDAGVLVTRVEPDGPAGRAGVRIGDVVIDVGGREVRAPVDVNGVTLAWHDDPSTSLVVVRDRERTALTVSSDRARQALTSAERELVERLRSRLEAERERLERRLREIVRQLDELAAAEGAPD